MKSVLTAALLLCMLTPGTGQSGQSTTTWFPQAGINCTGISSGRTLLLTSAVTDLGGDQVHLFSVAMNAACAENADDVCWQQGSAIYARAWDGGRQWECRVMSNPGSVRRRAADFVLTVLTPDSNRWVRDVTSLCSVVCRAGGLMPDGSLTDTVLCSDDDGMSWFNGPPVLWPSADASAWQVDGYVYLAGGMAGVLGNGSAAVVRAAVHNTTCRIQGAWEATGDWQLGTRSFASIAVAPGRQRVYASAGWKSGSASNGMVEAMYDLWQAPFGSNMTAWSLLSAQLPFTGNKTSQLGDFLVSAMSPRLLPNLALSEVAILDPYSYEKTDLRGYPMGSLSAYALLLSSGKTVMVNIGDKVPDTGWVRHVHVLFPGPIEKFGINATVGRAAPFNVIAADIGAGRQPILMQFEEWNSGKLEAHNGYPVNRCPYLCPAGEWAAACERNPWDRPQCRPCTTCTDGENRQVSLCGVGNKYRDTVCKPCLECSVADGLVALSKCNITLDTVCVAAGSGGIVSPLPIPAPRASITASLSSFIWVSLLSACFSPLLLIPMLMITSPSTCDSTTLYYCTVYFRRQKDYLRRSSPGGAESARGAARGKGTFYTQEIAPGPGTVNEPSSGRARVSALSEVEDAWSKRMKQGRGWVTVQLRALMFAGAWLSLTASIGSFSAGVVLLRLCQTSPLHFSPACQCGTVLTLGQLASLAMSLLPVLLQLCALRYWPHPLFHISLVAHLSQYQASISSSSLHYCARLTIARCLMVEVPSVVAICTWMLLFAATPDETSSIFVPLILVLLFLLFMLVLDVAAACSILRKGLRTSPKSTFSLVEEWTVTPLVRTKSHPTAISERKKNSRSVGGAGSSKTVEGIYLHASCDNELGMGVRPGALQEVMAEAQNKKSSEAVRIHDSAQDSSATVKYDGERCAAELAVGPELHDSDTASGDQTNSLPVVSVPAFRQQTEGWVQNYTEHVLSAQQTYLSPVHAPLSEGRVDSGFIHNSIQVLLEAARAEPVDLTSVYAMVPLFIARNAERARAMEAQRGQSSGSEESDGDSSSRTPPSVGMHGWARAGGGFLTDNSHPNGQDGRSEDGHGGHCSTCSADKNPVAPL